MLGFVNDKKHYVHNILKQLQQSIIEVMQHSIRVWDEILTFVGGKLERSKCNFCILNWTFDKSDRHILNNNKEIITFISERKIQVQSQKISPNDCWITVLCTRVQFVRLFQSLVH